MVIDHKASSEAIMPPAISNKATEDCLRKTLRAEGYQLTAARGRGETGVDIVASKRGTRVHIEVIGYKSSGPARARDFYESFFRAVSRLNDKASTCVIALPSAAKAGLPARAKHHSEAWRRIGRAFPELEIWLVDVATGRYEKTGWNEWLK